MICGLINNVNIRVEICINISYTFIVGGVIYNSLTAIINKFPLFIALINFLFLLIGIVVKTKFPCLFLLFYTFFDFKCNRRYYRNRKGYSKCYSKSTKKLDLIKNNPFITQDERSEIIGLTRKSIISNIKNARVWLN